LRVELIEAITAGAVSLAGASPSRAAPVPGRAHCAGSSSAKPGNPASRTPRRRRARTGGWPALRATSYGVRPTGGAARPPERWSVCPRESAASRSAQIGGCRRGESSPASRPGADNPGAAAGGVSSACYSLPRRPDATGGAIGTTKPGPTATPPAGPLLRSWVAASWPTRPRTLAISTLVRGLKAAQPTRCAVNTPVPVSVPASANTSGPRPTSPSAAEARRCR